MTALFTVGAVVRTAAILLYPAVFRRVHYEIKDAMRDAS